ncbi:MAG: hypothetical protein VW685_05005, partial [Ilumatobacter sp.]
MTPSRALSSLIGFSALALSSCGGGDSVTLYSGRGEDLVQPVVDACAASTGLDIVVRYGDSAEMLLLIQEEGDNSPADV